MRILILIILIITSSVASSPQSNELKVVEKVMMQYLVAIKSKDRKKLKSLITEKHYKELDQDNGIQKLFNMQSDDKKKIVLDFKVIKQKNGFRANVKGKEEKEYHPFWYHIVKEKDGYKVNGTFYAGDK